MGLNLKSSANNWKAPRRGRRGALNSEINVTPFVDVMLVLLIIFMVTSPMLVSGVEVDLPKTTLAPIHGNDEPLILSIDKKGDVYIQEAKLTMPQLEAKLKAILREKKEMRIFVRGDQDINYGKIMEIFALVRGSGFSNVALITEIDQRLH